MKKLLIIQGSPRKNGNTEFACRYVADRLGGTFEVSFVNLYDLDIHRCTGCRACMKQGCCVITEDDFPALWRKVEETDRIVLAAPVYWYAPPGLMKDFIDRTHTAFRDSGHLSGKTACLITVAADSGFETCETIMASWLGYYGTAVEKKLRLIAREAGDLAKKAANLKQLDELVDSLKD